MKISEIRIDGTKSLGNYENRKIGFTAVIEENEKAVDAVQRVQQLLDWALNRPERDAQYAKHTARLQELLPFEDDEKVIGEISKLQRWINQYDDLRSQVESIDIAA